jgi:hypothetical protein
VARILIIQPLRFMREIWQDALVATGHEVVACDSVHYGCLALWARDFDAMVVATPPDQQLAALLDAAPGPWPPPIVLVGAPFVETMVGVPRTFAAARCAASATAASVVDTVRRLLAGAGVARPAVPHGREDVPLRLPPNRIAKWRSWLAARA